MKKSIFTVAMLFFGSHAFATTIQPTILGDWNLNNRACTSNTPINDGVLKITVKFNDDKTFVLKRLVADCETEIKGTYNVEGMKVIFTSATSQSCTQTAPQPMIETYSMYAACHTDTELILVATGSKAAACPTGDALILSYERIQPATEKTR